MGNQRYLWTRENTRYRELKQDQHD